VRSFIKLLDLVLGKKNPPNGGFSFGGSTHLEVVTTLDIPTTAVEAKWAVFGVKLTDTAWVWRLIGVLIEEVICTNGKLKILSHLVSELEINKRC
jgi:hypothetical protein